MIRLIAISFLMMGCSYHVEKLPSDPSSLIDPNKAGFEEVKAGVLKAKCMSCHAEMMASHQSILPNIGEMAARVQSGSMPPVTAAPLSEAEKTLLLTWISRGGPLEGSQEVVPGPVVPPPPAVPLAGIPSPVKEIFAEKCMGCHKALFNSYEALLPEMSQIPFRIDDMGGDFQMPPARARKQLTDEEKEIIKSWISAGAPREQIGE